MHLENRIRTAAWILTTLGIAAAGLAQAPEDASLHWRQDIGFPTSHGVSYGGFMTVDSQDNVYACATPWGGYQLAKLDVHGELLWSRSIPGVHQPRTFYVAVDSQDNAITTGYDEGTWSYKTVKFDPQGNVLWDVESQHGIRDEAFRVAVDADDNVYVTGRSRDGVDFQWRAQTIKYDPDGNEVWVRRLPLGHPRVMAVAPDGRVVVAADNGDSWGLVSYDADGNELWTKLFQPANSTPEDIVMTEDGDAFVCGTTHVDGVTAAAVVRFGVDGSVIWHARYNGPNGPWDLFRRVALAHDGSVVAVGQSRGVGYLDWSTAVFDPAGQLVWSSHYSGFEANDEWATAVTAAPDGSVYVTGFAGSDACQPPATFLETTTVKYDALGNEVWSHSLPCSSYSGANALDSTGGVIMTSGWEVIRLVNEREPASYCTAKPGSCGLPSIAYSGKPSASSTSGFFAFASPARAMKNGFLLYTNAGPAALPFQGGTLCLAPAPLRRSVLVSSGGSPGSCDGEFLLDMNAFASGALGGTPADFLRLPGVVINAQWWARDSIQSGSLLSNGLEYSIAP